MMGHANLWVGAPCDQHCDSGGMSLICHVTSREHIVKSLCEFMGGSNSE